MTAVTDYLVEHGDKFRKDLVHFIESCEYGDDIGARISVLFDQDASQEYSEGLSAVRMVSR
jgi:hypothetical protein